MGIAVEVDEVVLVVSSFEVVVLVGPVGMIMSFMEHFCVILVY